MNRAPRARCAYPTHRVYHYVPCVVVHAGTLNTLLNQQCTIYVPHVPNVPLIQALYINRPLTIDS